MAYASASGLGFGASGSGSGVSGSAIFPDSSHPDVIVVPDAKLLFRGDFHRAGPDLVLTGPDGVHHIIPGYFDSESHPSLVAANGARLTGDVVELLSGSPTPGHYAQAQSTAPANSIGKIEKVVGSATVVRNGVAAALHVGDVVYKSDVVQTGDHSSVGISFPDGTALDLTADTRMALSDYSFDAGGTPNSALFTLVEGTFAFVAGQVAHTGAGMKITTPVATLGVRGTVGLFKSESTVVGANLGRVWSVILHEDLDGSHHLGRIAFIDQDPTSATFGQDFYVLDSSEYVAYLDPQGPGLPPHVRLTPLTNSLRLGDQHFFDDLGQILNLNNPNPQNNPNPGSSTPPDLLQIPPQLFQENGGQPLLINFPNNGGNNAPPTSPAFAIGFPFGKSIPTPTIVPLSTTFVWSAGDGNWDTPPGWNIGAVPTSSADTVEIQSGTVTYNADYTIGTLIVDPGATLDIVGGSLTVGTIEDDGTIIVDGDPPLLTITGSFFLGAGSQIEALGSGSEIEFSGGTADNQGIIAARQQGTVAFVDEAVTNEAGAKICRWVAARWFHSPMAASTIPASLPPATAARFRLTMPPSPMSSAPVSPQPGMNPPLRSPTWISSTTVTSSARTMGQSLSWTPRSTTNTTQRWRRSLSARSHLSTSAF